MARRQRKSDFDRAVEGLARLPWQNCLVLTPIAWFGFHQLAVIKLSTARNMNELGITAGEMGFRTSSRSRSSSRN